MLFSKLLYFQKRINGRVWLFGSNVTVDRGIRLPTYMFMHRLFNHHYDRRRYYAINHDDVIKWKHFPRYWPFGREFTGHRWILRTKASDAELWYFLWSAPWINSWVNNHEAGDLRRYPAHYNVAVMWYENHSYRSLLLHFCQISLQGDKCGRYITSPRHIDVY